MPLHRAAGNGHLEVVQFLCENKAAKDEQMSDGRTPLSVALSGVVPKNKAPYKRSPIGGLYQGPLI